MWKKLWRTSPGNVDDIATSPVVHVGTAPRVQIRTASSTARSPGLQGSRRISPGSTAVMTTDVLKLFIRGNYNNINNPEAGDNEPAVMEEA
jgi:hypothetical protein